MDKEPHTDGGRAMSIEVLDPTHGDDPEVFRAAPRLDDLDGVVIGLISNGKQGTKSFFDALESELLDAGVGRVDRVTKANYSAPAEPAVMDRAKRWQAVVAGVGD
jgi:hypothetical protein